MSTTKGKAYTYIQDSMSPEQRKQVLSHMDQLGFGSTTDPDVFGTGATVFPIVSASRDALGGASILPMHSHSFSKTTK